MYSWHRAGEFGNINGVARIWENMQDFGENGCTLYIYTKTRRIRQYVQGLGKYEKYC